MRLLLKVNILDDMADNNGCDYILINLDEVGGLLRVLYRAAKPLFKTDSFYAASWFNFDFYPVSFKTVEEADWFDPNAEVQEVPDEVELDCSDFRVDAATIRVKENEFLWHFHEKHAGTAFESASVRWDSIKD